MCIRGYGPRFIFGYFTIKMDFPLGVGCWHRAEEQTKANLAPKAAEKGKGMVRFCL